MSQNQEQIEAQLAAYVDNELNESDRAAIEKHLAGNPSHRELIAELMVQRNLLHALPREKAPPEIAETIQNQLERSVLLGNPSDADQRTEMRISRWPQYGGIAAILLLTAGLAFSVYKMLPSNKAPTEFAKGPAQTGPVGVPLATDEEPKSDNTLAEKSLSKSGAGYTGRTEIATANKLAINGVNSIQAVSAKGAADEKAADGTGRNFAVTPGENGALTLVPPALSNSAAASNPAMAEALDQSRGVVGQPVSMIVSADDVAVAREQVRSYLLDNQIEWSPVSRADVAGPRAFAASEPSAIQTQTIATGTMNIGNIGLTPTTQPAEAVVSNDGIFQKRFQPQTTDQQATADQQQVISSQPKLTPATAPVEQTTGDVFPTIQQQKPEALPAASMPASGVFYCRDVTVRQAQELEAALTARAGQTVRILYATAGPVAEGQDQLQLAATEPTSQPVNGDQALNAATTEPAAASPAIMPTTQPALAANAPALPAAPPVDTIPATQPQEGVAAIVGTPVGGGNDLTLQSVPQTQPQRSDLLIIVNQTVAPATQP